MIGLIIVVELILLVVAVIALLAERERRRQLARRLKAIDDPVLHLSRRDRRAHARKLLEREQQEYDLQRQREFYDVINGNNTEKEI